MLFSQMDPSEWVFCQACKRCYRWGEASLDEDGHPWCAYKDCELMGDGHDTIPWTTMRQIYPAWPEVPERGMRYLPRQESSGW